MGRVSKDKKNKITHRKSGEPPKIYQQKDKKKVNH